MPFERWGTLIINKSACQALFKIVFYSPHHNEVQLPAGISSLRPV
jgi:hypothetical protein